MAIQYSVALRNAQLDQIEILAAASARLFLYSGTVPATTATAASGTLLCNILLPSDWMNAASAGSKTLLGTWTGTGEAGAGTGTAAGYFRVVDNAGTVVTMQGTITGSGLGGDLTMDNVSIAASQTVTIATFTVNALNA